MYNNIWLTNLLNVKEFPEVESYPNFILAPYKTIFKRRGYSSFSGLDDMQKEINRLYAQIQNSITDMSVPKITVGCDHSWKSYQGFTENYDYCEKCDLKK